MGCDGLAVLCVIELIFCTACLIYKRVTDDEAIETYLQLQKLSREWPLLNNVTRDENGALFAEVIFGGFTLITLGRLIAHLCGELKKARIMNCFFLVLGCVTFLIVGAYVLTSVDEVPHGLTDNAIILGILSIITGILFLIDLGIVGNKSRDEPKRITLTPVKDVKKKPTSNGVLKDLKSSFRKKKKKEETEQKTVEFKEEETEKEENKMQEREMDDTRQYGRRKLENRGFVRESPDGLGRPRSRWDDDWTYDRRSRRMEVELEEEYLRPPDQYRLQDHRVSSSRHDLSDDEGSLQIPSVSFLMSERAKKIMPSVSTSPVERVQDVRPRYYFNSSRDVEPGYVLRTASKLSESSPPTVSDRLQSWFNSRPAKHPP